MHGGTDAHARKERPPACDACACCVPVSFSLIDKPVTNLVHGEFGALRQGLLLILSRVWMRQVGVVPAQRTVST